MQQSLSHARKMMKIEVLSFAKNLIRYYERLGYSLTGKTNTFFHGSCVKADFQSINKEYLLEMTKILQGNILLVIQKSVLAASGSH